jgi:GT2 family glycosyltransferase
MSLFELASFRRLLAPLRPAVRVSRRFFTNRRISHDWHLLFDNNYYLGADAELKNLAIDPSMHFRTVGWRERRNPHPFFDTGFYLDMYPHVVGSGLDPLSHYLAFGWRQGLDPHPLFQTNLYLQHYPDVAGRRMNPLVHYVTGGRQAGRQPSWIRLPQLPNVEHGLTFLPITFPEVGFPRVSIVIPVHGKAEMTICCLHALRQHETIHTFEVIVVDDGSDEVTQSALSQVHGIRILRHHEARGFLISSNAGAEVGRGEFLLFLNNDTFVQPGWLDELLAVFSARSDAGAVGSALVYPNGRLQEVGCVVWNDGTAWQIGRGHDPDDPSYSFLREVDYCSAASLLVPSELFRRLQGFDLRYAPGYFEDTDLCFRIRCSGLKVYCQPLSRVVHIEGATAGRDPSNGMKRFQAVNRIKFLAQWTVELARAAAPIARGPLALRLSGHRRIVVIDHKIPMADRDAGSMIVMEIIALLQSFGYAITILPLLGPEQRDERVMALERTGIEVVRRPYYDRPLDYLLRNDGEFCLLFLVRYVSVEMALPYFNRLRHRTPQILLDADLHYLRAERQAFVYGDPKLAKAAAREKRHELAAMRRVDMVLTHSDYELALLRRKLPNKEVGLLPWVVQPAEGVPSYESRRDLLFVGNFNHAPNVDAMVNFVGHVWPALRQRLPNVRLRIVGSNVNPAIQSLRGDGVDLVGYVADLRREFDHARVAVAPLRFGAGFKGKVAGAIAAGLPNVLSPVAAEGMGLASGETCIIAEIGDPFVDAVERLYTDDPLWTRISQAGLALARREWTREHAATRLLDFLRKAEAGGSLQC